MLRSKVQSEGRAGKIKRNIGDGQLSMEERVGKEGSIN